MESPVSRFEGQLDRYAIVAGVLLLGGLILAGSGLYVHESIVASIRAGQCDGCAPWHPLFVVGPIVIGVSSVLLGITVANRR